MNIAELTARIEFGIDDYSDEDLSGLDLTGFNLTNKCFNGCNFDNTILNDSDCSGSTFEDARMINAQIFNTKFRDPEVEKLFKNVGEETIF